MTDFDDWDAVADSLAETEQEMLETKEKMKKLEEEMAILEAERVARLEAEQRLRDVKVEKKMTARQQELAEKKSKRRRRTYKKDRKYC